MTTTATTTTTDTPDPNAGGGTRPEGLPEKFKTVTDMAASYAALEQKLGQMGVNNPPTKIESPNPTPQKTPEGVNMKSLGLELRDNGRLSEDTYRSLAAKGLDRAAADQLARGAFVEANRIANSLVQIAGGQNQLRAVNSWAAANLSTEEVDSYNDIMEGGNVGVAKLALEGLMARYTADTGLDPRLVDGESMPLENGGPAAFRSTEEVKTAMRDPRYATDSAYRKQVEARMAKTEGLFLTRTR